MNAVVLQKSCNMHLREALRTVFILLFYMSQIVISEASDMIVSGARIGGDELRTRFVLDVSRKVPFEISQSKDRQQVRILLPPGTYTLPEGAGQSVRGLVKGFRYGAADAEHTQIIVDTLKPVSISSSEFIDSNSKKPARLVIDLEPAPDLVSLSSERTTSTPIRTIVLDPGHGGIDPGAISIGKYKEKDIVFAFVKRLAETLEATGRYRIVYTRDSDIFVSLPERVRRARAAKADLLIAVHADTIRGKTARGTTLYTLSDKASDVETEAFARKENRADAAAGLGLPPETDAVTDVLFDLVQRETRGQAVLFSQTAVTELAKVTNLTSIPLRSAGFVVLKAPDVPSVLVELGYLSSREDEKLLIDPVWQKMTSEALTRAIDAHFAAAGLTTSSTDLPALPSP
jgi:N-acetylmuramoyl-L-alanine amidase